MKKILFIPFGLLSHYLRLLEFASILREISNYDGVFLSHPAYDVFIENRGFRTTVSLCFDFVERINDYATTFNFDWINIKFVSYVVNHLEKIIHKEKPDIIVSDTFLGVRIVAEKWDILHVALLNAYVTNHYACFRDVPYHHKAHRFKKYVNAKQWEALVRSVETLTLRKVHSPFRKIRKKYNLPLHQNLFDEFLGKINLICDDPQIFPLKKSLPQYHYIGPLLYQSNEIDMSLLDFVEKYRSRPMVYVTTGSSGRNIVPEILNPDEFDDVFFIISGAKYNHQKKNSIFRQFINFTSIQDKLKLIINHGGNGSMYQALNAGLPIISIPWNFEQEWNVQRFNQLGLCEIHYPSDSPQKLKVLIEKKIGSEANVHYKHKYDLASVKNTLKGLVFKLLN